MERTSRLEGIFRRWQREVITDWRVIQDNIAQITITDGQRFVLKELGLSNDAAIRRLQFEHDILHHVEQLGVSAAVPMLSAQGVPYVVDGDQLYRLSNWLPNQRADVQTAEELEQLYQNYGRAIGRFHNALAIYKDDEILTKTWQTDLQKRLLEEALPVVLQHLDQSRLSAFQTSLAEIEPAMSAAFANLPIQPIIWDCHPGNVAVQGFDVSGFIDCDHIALAPRIFDVADFLVHLIKWEVGCEMKEAMWLATYRHLIFGYESVAPLSKREREALFYAMVGIPLIFMDFFFQAGMPELIKVEFDTFRWLVRHRQTIIAQLDMQG